MESSNSSSGFVDNWQAGKNVTDCNLHMLTTEDSCDVIFHVGSEKRVVRAHRYVLVSRSCVFRAMFCGPLAEKGEVTIPDIEPHVFKEFLRYVYTETANITTDNANGLLYTSRKYAIDALVNNCTQFLENSLSEENVCKILEQCHIYGEVDLEQKGLTILTEAGETVIKSPGFLDLCTECFEKFLKSSQLRLKEAQIFEATLSWTTRACKEANVPSTRENIRKFLGDMVYEIRFSSMPMDYLKNVVGQTEILSENEKICIKDKALRPDADISPFKSTPRKRIRPQHPEACLCAQRLHSDVAFGIPPGEHAISFSVSRYIHLVGFQLYGPCFLAAKQISISVQLINTADNTTLQSFTKAVPLNARQLNNIMFSSAVPMNPGFTYTLCVRIVDVDTCCGTGGRQSVHVDGVTFTFTDSSLCRASTTVSQGQIPGLLFKQIL